jgi:hypothetical protein
MQDTDTHLAPAGEEFTDLSLAQDLRQLADEAKTLAQAELAFQKSRAAFVGGEAKAIAALLVVALVVVFFAVMALVVGTVIALGPVLGPWGAMAAVTLVLLAIAAFSALSAKGRLKRMMIIAGSGNET